MFYFGNGCETYALPGQVLCNKGVDNVQYDIFYHFANLIWQFCNKMTKK